jgi:hypothetical protein
MLESIDLRNEHQLDKLQGRMQVERAARIFAAIEANRFAGTLEEIENRRQRYKFCGLLLSRIR